MLKKTLKVALVIAIPLIVIGGIILFYGIATMPQDRIIDLEKFSGRVFQEDVIKPGTFTINTPMDEAVKWGNEAILRYGERGVEIWRPDSITPNVFQYAAIPLEGGHYVFNTSWDSNNKKLVINTHSFNNRYLVNIFVPLSILWLFSFTLCMTNDKLLRAVIGFGLWKNRK